MTEKNKSDKQIELEQELKMELSLASMAQSDARRFTRVMKECAPKDSAKRHQARTYQDASRGAAVWHTLRAGAVKEELEALADLSKRVGEAAE